MRLSLVKNENNMLVSAFNSDLEKLSKLKQGQVLTCEIKRVRNANFHRKFFALLNLVFENQEIFDDIEHLRKELTKAAGYYTSYTNHKGVKIYEAKSISFANMDNTEFENFYNKMLNTIEKIFNFDKQTINENIKEFY